MFRRPKLSEAQVYDILKTVKYPGFTRDIVSFGLVQNVQVQGQNVDVTIQMTTNQQDVAAQMRQAVDEALRGVPGIGTVQVMVRLKEQTPQAQPQAPGPQHASVAPLPGVQHIVAVASGKGGVGKSTVATNLAVALSMAGMRTGLLDADIYGPSIPLMMGVHAKPQVNEANRILPFLNHGVKMQSLGFFLGEDAPVIWRGPMVMRAVQQLLQDTDWGELDVLVVDLPPGTGDVQLTLAQTVPLTGAILVTTPQDLALLDVKKGAEMFKQVGAPLLGIVENMSFFTCPDCGKETEIFRHGGGQKESTRLGIPLIGHIPLEPSVCDAGDTGIPVAIGQPETRAGVEFHQIAATVVEMLSQSPRRAAVKIIN
ncbi:MAG: Mrp/NBP35 family ATP-binding protein [Candidatus Tectomicrobia bacterium]|uniref:Iron-sulfur cluster carrier protein n=1 Tax=Tectimicrobiota bacterium TaxID=2528274 RepID=A0A937VYC1_UNCTE|nr:Mrp/NBP35 family ATP-binding protein [Candidatus Tectomicrobia bacterium]